MRHLPTIVLYILHFIQIQINKPFIVQSRAYIKPTARGLKVTLSMSGLLVVSGHAHTKLDKFGHPSILTLDFSHTLMS